MAEVAMSIPPSSYIVMQAYGSADILHECAFALASLCSRHTRAELANLTVCIYTDQPEYFRAFSDCWLNIHFRYVDEMLLAAWRGNIDFVHRVKIEVLRDFSANHEGNVLYLDTDVVFANPVSEIFEQIASGKLYMHVMEGPVHHSRNAVFQKLSGFFKKGPVMVHNRLIEIPDQAMMWNAGVLGFHTQHAPVLKDVLDFTDDVYRQFPKHVVEQFAFSFYFQRTALLLSAHTSIYHYWNLKELRPVLASFFLFFRDKNWDGLVYFSRLIQLPDYLQQKANYYANRSTLDKLLGRKWKASIPDWNLLLQQL